MGVLALRADGLTATLLLPLGLAMGAFAVAAPRRFATGPTLAAASTLLAATLGALVADNLLVLLLAELVAGAAVVQGLRPVGGRVGRAYLSVSGLLAIAALVFAFVQGTALRPLDPSAPLGIEIGLLLLAAVWVRLGVLPAQSGLTATLTGSPGPAALLLAAPFGAMPTLIRVVQPALRVTELHQSLVLAALAMATTAALVAVTSRDLSRSAGWTLAALNGLLLAGNIEEGATGALGGELLWAALCLSSVGFLLAVAHVSLRLGAVDLRRLHGLQVAAPRLALVFLLLALSLAGVPGSLEFIAEDVLLNGATSGGLAGSALTVLTIAVVGYNALRCSFQVFYGKPDASHVDMDLQRTQGIALLSLVALLFAGGMAPGLLPLVSRAASAASGH